MIRRKILSLISNQTPIDKPLPALCCVNYLKTVAELFSFIFEHKILKYETCPSFMQNIYVCGCDCITDRQLIHFVLLLRNEIFCYNKQKSPFSSGVLLLYSSGLCCAALFPIHLPSLWACNAECRIILVSI
jgi:hypothetical protein